MGFLFTLPGNEILNKVAFLPHPFYIHTFIMSDVEDFRSAMLNIRPGHAALRRRQKAEAEKAAAEGKAVVAEEPMDPRVKMFIISLCVALLSWALYLPYNNSQKLMGYNRATIDDVGVEKCRKFIGPSYCDDVRVHKLSGLAFLSCDTAKAIWNPPFGVENDTLIQNLPRSGEIWVQDLKLVCMTLWDRLCKSHI